MTSNLLINW